MKRIISMAILGMLMGYTFISCDPPTEAETTGSIEGIIYDASTSQPLAGVTITTEPITSSKITVTNGSFLIEGVEPETYTLQAVKTGFNTNSTTVNVVAGETTTADLQLSPLAPELSISTALLNFGTGSTSLAFTITNSGVGILTWNVISVANWITINPANGSTENESDVVTVTVNRTAMSFGNHYETITIGSNANSVTIDILMTIQNPNAPQLSVYPVALDFESSDTEMSLNIQNTGTGLLTWNVTDDKSWLSISPQSGTTENEVDELTVTIDRLNQSPGVQTGTIIISSDGGNQNISVQFTIPDEPTLSVTPSSLDFGSEQTVLPISIANAGSGDLSWSVSDNQAWIVANPTAGTNDGTVNITISRDGVSPGNYSGTVTIDSDGGTDYVEISMTMPADEPPSAVTLVDPSNITVNSMTLSWSRNIESDFAAYLLYYDTSPAVTENSTLATTITDNNTNSYTISSLSTSTTYYFRIYVMDAVQQTTGSNVVTASTSAILGSWVLTENVSGVNFNGVWFNSENDGFIVGESSTAYDAVVYHWGGASWVEEVLPESASDLYDIQFTDPNNGYAVGYEGTFLYNNGIAWSEFNSPTTATIGAVSPLSPDNIWCYASNDIYHWDGSEWSSTSLDIGTIKDLNFVDENDGWVVDQYGKIYHYNGFGWSLSADVDIYSSFYGNVIEFLNSSEGWYTSCNDNYTGLYYNYAYHFDGSGWTRYVDTEYPIHKVESMHAISASNVWAVGISGVIFNYNGERWNSITSPVSSNLNRVHMLSATDGWAVGSDGAILRYH